MEEKDEMEYRCPFCHSTDCAPEMDFEEIKKAVRKKIDEVENPTPELLNMLNELLRYDLYDDEEYLNRLATKGLSITCLNCGSQFYEKDKEPDEWKAPTEISKEDFFSIINECFIASPKEFVSLNDKKLKLAYEENPLFNVKTYYKERALMIVEEILKSKKEFEEIIEDKKLEEVYS